jgi:GNAT superfamily N-acetyltransferase
MDNPAIAIRVAQPSDHELVTRILTAAYARLDDGSYDGDRLSDALPLMSRANPRLLNSGTYFLAMSSGIPAGCGGWTLEAPGTGTVDPGVGHIRHFATHPDHLRKGVAQALLRRCLDEARAAGVALMKSQSTLPAQKFYASAGFSKVRDIEVAMGPGAMLPAVEMELRLD